MDFNNIIAFYFENAGRQKILHSESVKETKVLKELFSLCSISIFAAFIR